MHVTVHPVPQVFLLHTSSRMVESTSLHFLHTVPLMSAGEDENADYLLILQMTFLKHSEYVK